MTNRAGLPRRQLLCGLAVGLLAPGVLAACGTGTSRVNGVGSAKPGTQVAAVNDIPVGGGNLVNVGTDGYLLVTQPTAGDIKAFDPTCPHLGATVDPPAGGIITCPAHGSEFNPDNGAVERGPATTGLTEVPVRVQAGQIVLA
ncbi:MAG TPA: Rieske (2Fe-2S) protein [Pseudonocardiaceae bacterium]|nr:Rieske (2Fe-2S) protein [Pseudonocardiaceae bacterium]